MGRKEMLSSYQHFTPKHGIIISDSDDTPTEAEEDMVPEEDEEAFFEAQRKEARKNVLHRGYGVVEVRKQQKDLQEIKKAKR